MISDDVSVIYPVESNEINGFVHYSPKNKQVAINKAINESTSNLNDILESLNKSSLDQKKEPKKKKTESSTASETGGSSQDCLTVNAVGSLKQHKIKSNIETPSN